MAIKRCKPEIVQKQINKSFNIRGYLVYKLTVSRADREGGREGNAMSAAVEDFPVIPFVHPRPSALTGRMQSKR